MTNLKTYPVFSVSDTIRFTYKGGRLVVGDILRIDPKGILLKLKDEYIGMQEEWQAGSNKYFNKKEMKQTILV